METKYAAKLVRNSLLVILLVNFATADFRSDYPGPYCAKRDDNGEDSCCNNRKDVCSVPISTTLCYCDEFCKRDTNSDCCPDYESYCLGQAPPAAIKSCHHKGIYFTEYDPPVKDNCNECKCTVRNGEAVANCDRNTCLVDEDVIQAVNSHHSLGWTAVNYTQFFGRKYSYGLTYRLGTFEPIRRVKSMSQLSNRFERIPAEFNSLTNWPGLISEVRDQGWCGSSWSVSTASVASDRFSIKSKGLELVELSPQQLLSCVRKSQGCDGGHLDNAWSYFRNTGVVDEDCFRYDSKDGALPACKVHRGGNLAKSGCRLPTKVPRTDFYKMGPAYSLRNETDIKFEIFHYGPVQATMRVYHDFFHYQRGVYRRSSFGETDKVGFHSVRLIGWGEENDGTKYWIAINSWGQWWGEQGYFRILRGTNECEIEDYVLSSMANIHSKQNVRGNLRRN